MTVRIGELALAAGVLTPRQLDAARVQQKQGGGRLGAVLVSLGYVTEQQVTDLVARQYGLPAVNDLDSLEVRPKVLALVPREHCVSHCVLPLARHGAALQMAMADPTNVFAMDPIQFRTGLKVKPLVAAESAITRALQRLYGEPKGLEPVGGGNGHAAPPPAPLEELNPADIPLGGVEIDPDWVRRRRGRGRAGEGRGRRRSTSRSLTHGSADRPVVGLVNRILVEAYRRGASDIHVEPYEKEFAVRFRIDGVLVEYGNLPPRVRETRHHAHQDHGEPGHRGAAAAAGRAHQDPHAPGRPGARPRLPRLLPADSVGREDRAPAARQGPADARHDEARASRSSRCAASRRRSPSPTASSSSPAPPGRARRTPSTRRSPLSTSATPTS